jgi:hypothetical protein
MPQSWNTEAYRNQAKGWRAAAEKLPPGKEREACLTLADGYAHLASLIDSLGLDSSAVPERPPPP